MKANTQILIGRNSDGRYFFRHPTKDLFVYFAKSERKQFKSDILTELQWGQNRKLNWVSDQPTPLKNADGITAGWLL
jgi:hypothetical protein